MPDFTDRDVRAAFAAIRREGIPNNFGPSTKWDIVDDQTSERFPPKAILFLAKRVAGDSSRSGGGGDIGTNNALRQRGFQVVLKHDAEPSDEASDIENVLASDADATTKRRLINARLGQGGFREELLELWDRKCALTQVNIEPVLRASHIKAWRYSEDHERLDSTNGLLLAASVDALFDRHLISFDDRGEMLVCSTLERATLQRIGLRPGSWVKLSKGNRFYLQWHRAEFEKRGEYPYRF
jgi:hypothetical protein